MIAGSDDREARKRRVADSFNTIAADYEGLRFVHACAQRLIERAALPAGARVLDLATGTGLVALVAAELVGPAGRVVGVDISPEMLALARAKLAAAGPLPVELREGDAERLDLPDQSFDVVLCASSLFFVPDMLAALRECHRVLVPGGRVGFSSFGRGFLQPLYDLWLARLSSHGVPQANPPQGRLADPAVCRELLAEAGFSEISVEQEQVGYFVAGPAERLAEISAGLEGMPLRRLDPAEREQIRAEHLEELRAHGSPEGIWVDVPANFAFGRRPV